MTPIVIPMTTHQILLQVKEACHHYAARRFIDAFDAACCAAFIAYYGMLRTPDGVEVYHRVMDIRAECRWQLLDLVRKATVPCLSTPTTS